MVAANLVLNLTLVWIFAEAGLALATALCASVQCVILYAILKRRVELNGQSRLRATLLKTCVATAAMVAVALVALRLVPGAPESDEVAVKAVRLCVPLGAGAFAFFVTAAILRVPEMGTFLRGLKRLARDGRR
jgi:putative peptidoglycan lipid II flippase